MFDRRRIAEKYAVEILYTIVGAPSSNRILDVGCGQKVQSTVFVQNNNEYYGIDLDIRKMHMYKNEVLIRADAAHLPFQPSKFNIAFSRELLHHVEDPIEVIKEMFRVSTRIVLIESNKYAPYLIGVYYSGHRHFSIHEFKNILRKTSKTEPDVRFTGIYAYNSNFSIADAVRQSMSFVFRQYKKLRKKETKPHEALLGIIFSPTVLLERLCYFLTTFSPNFFFFSKLFANRFLGFEMVFDSHSSFNV